MYKKVMWATDGSEAADRALVHAKALAAEGGHSAIVVGTRGRTALTGLLLGGVTQRLLHIAPCPVLAVPPEHSSDG